MLRKNNHYILGRFLVCALKRGGDSPEMARRRFEKLTVKIIARSCARQGLVMTGFRCNIWFIVNGKIDPVLIESIVTAGSSAIFRPDETLKQIFVSA